MYRTVYAYIQRKSLEFDALNLHCGNFLYAACLLYFILVQLYGLKSDYGENCFACISKILKSFSCTSFDIYNARLYF